jgi:ABC-type Fe3+/spermidine/putrescine transport system ATPase subunit
MSGGRIEQIDTPRDLYMYPKTAFARDFLGRTVVLRGIVTQTGSGMCTIQLAGTAAIASALSVGADAAEVGSDVYACLRPEDLDVRRADGQGVALNELPGLVDAVLFLGDRQECRVRLPNQEHVIIHVPRRHLLTEGDAVLLKIASEAVTVWPV